MSGKRRRAWRWLVAAHFIAAAPAFGAERTKTVALKNAAAPGSGAGVSFLEFGEPTINSHSQVLFRATVAGTGITTANDSGLWFGTGGGTTSRVLQEGMAAPGMPAGYTVGNFSLAVSGSGKPGSTEMLQESGKFLGSVPVSWTGGGGRIAYSGPAGGTLAPLAIPGAATPSGKGVWGPVVNVVGNPAGTTIALNDVNKLTLWRKDGAGAVQPVLDVGTLPAGYFNDNLMMYVTRNGYITYSTDPDQADIQTNNGNGAYIVTGTTSTKVMAYGDQAPAGTPGGGGVVNPSAPRIGPSGKFMVADYYRRTIWTGTVGNSTLTPFMLPNTLPGTTSVSMSVSVVPVNSADTVFMRPWLSGPGVTTANDQAILLGSLSDPGGLKTLIREGDVLPHSGGAKFAGLNNNDPFVIVNSQNQALIPASGALYGYDPSIGVMSLVRAGDSLQVSPNVFKTVSEITLPGDIYVAPLSGFNDGDGSALNDLGEVVFRAIFTDGSRGVFTTRIPVAGDATADGLVNSADLRVLRANYGKAGTRANGDFDGDGMVTFNDYQILEDNFGRHTLPVIGSDVGMDLGLSEVPEPAGVGLIGTVAVWVLGRRHAREERVA